MNNYPSFTEIVSAMDAENKIDFSSLSPKQAKALRAIEICHTEACGFVKEECPECGFHQVHYGSCNNTSCPQCGAAHRKDWEKNVSRKLINAPYYHIVFTIPDNILNRLILFDTFFMLSVLMSAAAEALKTLSADPKYFGVQKPGFVTVLHTWGSALTFHCHVHVIFCGAGLDSDGNLILPGDPKKFLFPAKKLAAQFKKLFLRKVSRKYESSDSPWLNDLNDARQAQWNVQLQYCGDNPRFVVKYLSRYVNRVAISNQRLISYDNETVCFKYKDYKHGSKIRQMKLKDTEFLRRFLMHILPERFVKSRFYGFMANNQQELLKKLQAITGYEIPQEPESWKVFSCEHKHQADIEEYRCPKCQALKMQITRKSRTNFKKPENTFMKVTTVSQGKIIYLSG